VNVEFLPVASVELEEAIDYYNGKRAGWGERLRAEVAAAVERIVAFPEAWTTVSPRTRRCQLHRFPYGVVYQVRPDRILVISVMHLRRRPGYWQDRLP
jgi:plasmid stabilization system protein ParE